MAHLLEKNSEEKTSFLVEWYDQQAAITKQFYLYYYVEDGSIEMLDCKSGRMFLKKCSYPSVKQESLFVGAQLTIYARVLKVVDYGDDDTRAALSNAHTRTLFIMVPSAYRSLGHIIDLVNGSNFQISRLKMVQLDHNQAASLHANVAQFTNGPTVLIEFLGKDPQRLGEQLDRFGIRLQASEADQASKVLFKSKSTTAQLNNCTVCVIKPHAIKSNNAGAIIDRIMEHGLEISALQMLALDRNAAEEFLEVYRGVTPSYADMVSQICSGLCIAMELRGDSAVEKFRELAGPPDSEIARHIRPHTIRAEFGVDGVENAIHCTDLVEDGVLESEYLFHLIQK